MTNIISLQILLGFLRYVLPQPELHLPKTMSQLDEFAKVDDADFAIEGENDEEDITATAASQDVASDMHIKTVCMSCSTPFTPMAYSTVPCPALPVQVSVTLAV